MSFLLNIRHSSVEVFLMCKKILIGHWVYMLFGSVRQKKSPHMRKKKMTPTADNFTEAEDLKTTNHTAFSVWSSLLWFFFFMIISMEPFFKNTKHVFKVYLYAWSIEWNFTWGTWGPGKRNIKKSVKLNSCKICKNSWKGGKRTVELHLLQALTLLLIRCMTLSIFLNYSVL